MTVEEIDWFPVLITEFLVISIINGITIAAFARADHPTQAQYVPHNELDCSRSTGRVGAVTGPLIVYYYQRFWQMK